MESHQRNHNLKRAFECYNESNSLGDPTMMFLLSIVTNKLNVSVECMAFALGYIFTRILDEKYTGGEKICRESARSK